MHLDVPLEERFSFGKNWNRFVDLVDADRTETARQSLVNLLGTDDLTGMRLLDAGSGSGLFSLAARQLGATVHSMDFDPESVRATSRLRASHRPDDDGWTVERGSVLDADHLTSLGTFDVAYSWGVVHHTGSMWDAIAQLTERVAPGGLLALSIYNKTLSTPMWRRIKHLYVHGPAVLRPLLTAFTWLICWGPTAARDTLAGDPTRSWRGYGCNRGMGALTDLVDWVGGYPFEAATPGEVFAFCRERGFELQNLITRDSARGCNEFAFRRADA